MIRIGLTAVGIVIGTATAGNSPYPDTVDGLWQYSHARCPGGDVTVQNYRGILVIQGSQAAQETAVTGCASQTRIMSRVQTPDGAVLRYRGASTSCTPGPACFGSFQTVVLGRVAAATFSCSAGPTYGESGPYALESADVMVSPVPGERGCVSVWTRIEGPQGLLP